MPVSRPSDAASWARGKFVSAVSVVIHAPRAFCHTRPGSPSPLANVRWPIACKDAPAFGLNFRKADIHLDPFPVVMMSREVHSCPGNGTHSRAHITCETLLMTNSEFGRHQKRQVFAYEFTWRISKQFVHRRIRV